MAIVIPVDTDTSAAESSLDRLKRHAKDAADKVKGSFKGTADGFEDLGDAVGLPVDKIKKLSSAMTLLASPVGIIGVSVAAVTVGFVAAAAAGAALIAGVVKLTESSAKAIPGLLKLQDASGVKLFSEQDTDRVLTADAAIQSVGASASATGVAISSDLAPYVTEAAVLLTSLNLALGDFISKNDSLVQGLVKVGEAIVNAFFAPLQGAAVVMAGFLAQAATLVGLVDKDLAANLNGVAASLAEWSIAGPVAGTIKTLTTVTAGYRSEAEKLVIGQKALNAEMKTTSDLAAGVDAAIADLGDLFDNTALAQEEANAAVDAILDNVEKMPSAYVDVLLAVEDVTEKTKGWRAEMEGVVASATTALGAMSSADSALSALSTAGPWGAFIAGLISFIKDFDESLKSFSDFHAEFMQALGDLPMTLAKHLQDTFVESGKLAVEAIPKFVTGLVEAIPLIIDTLADGIPKITGALVEAFLSAEMLSAMVELAWKFGTTLGQVQMVVQFATAFAESLGQVIGKWWDNFASGQFIDDVKEAALWAAVSFAAKVREMFEWAVEALKEVFTLGFADTSLDDNQGTSLGSKVKDVIKEIFTLGQAETQYGDTPGVVQAGSEGMRARFKPRDKVAASQTDAGLLAQVLDNLGGGGMQPAMAGSGPVTVNWADAHRSFDGFFVRHAALGGRSTAFMNRPTGRG